MEKPLVSVIIPTYKREEKLKRAVKSVLNQTYENVEIIVINDDPETDINDLLQEAENLKLINHEVNKGGAGARNTGIDKA
ncbi:MAG: glycosyltransferase family 2 protein, partial [Candidatus Natronoplasma sp.]